MKIVVCLFITAAVMSDNISALNVNLEMWMRDLPDPLKEIPLIYLAIPGSHDSMTFGITRSSQLAPDAEPIMHNLYPLFRGTILRWSITQAIDTTQQLLIGIRYFDLRLATKQETEDIFFTHGLYADEITQPLNSVKDFVDTHPGEVVILDFQHFYNFTPADHQRLIRMLLNMFGRRLVPRQVNLERVTLKALHQLNQQIIIVYRHQAVYATGEFWQPQTMPSPWPRQSRVSGLLNFMDTIKRHPGVGFVHQAVLTPTTTFIVLRWSSSLKEKCAKPVVDEVLPKLAEFSPGPPLSTITKAPVNVVIADFVDLDNAIFPKTVINLNFKLLRNDQAYQSSDSFTNSGPNYNPQYSRTPNHPHISYQYYQVPQFAKPPELYPNPSTANQDSYNFVNVRNMNPVQRFQNQRNVAEVYHSQNPVDNDNVRIY